MKRSAKWGLVSLLTVGLMTPLAWHDRQPVPRSEATPAPVHDQGARTAQVHALQMKKNKGNEQVVAQDIARTAALCVRDCRTMLTDISNELSHAKTEQEKLAILETHKKMHPQFTSLSISDGKHTKIQAGSPLRMDLQQKAQEFAAKDDFYVSDLYRVTTSDATKKIGMTLGVPILTDSHVQGALSADIEMGHLMQVMKSQDEEMGTTTRLSGIDGYNEAQGKGAKSAAKGDVSTNQLSARSAHAKVDGTAWRVHTSSLQNRGTKHNYMPDEVLVTFHDDLSQPMIQQMTKDIGGQLVKSNSRHAYIFRSKNMPVDQMVKYFKNHGAVIAEPHARLRKNDANERVVEQPNDMFYSSNQFNLPQIAADKAWQISTGNPNIKIAVVDTGLDLNHPDFKGKVITGYNVIDKSNNPQDDNGHGTHVSGIIAARTNNLEGIAGIDWASKIMPVKAMAADGSGSAVDIADGITWAADHGANVINLSLGEYNDSDYLHEAIRYAHGKGAVIVSAMGNDGVGDPSYPAAYPEVIAVSATDENNETASFSNYGPHNSVAAPGVSIPSTYLDKRYVTLSGTSMSTPHVAGVVALMKSINPNLSADQVRTILQQTATDLGPSGKDDYFGYGQINVQKAVTAAKAAAGK